MCDYGKSLLDKLLNSSSDFECGSPILQSKRPQCSKTKSDVSDRKVMSEIVCMEPSSEKELLKTEVVPNWLDPADCTESNKNIAIVGQTQIGKNYVLKNLLNLLKEKCWYKYIFYVSLKEVEPSQVMNILQFLTSNDSNLSWIDCTDESIFEQKCFRKVIEILMNKENHGICIIFDDLEKSNFFEYHKDDPHMASKNYFDKAEAKYIFSRILRNYGFKFCRKILLLNLWHYFQLDPIYKLKPIFVHGINHQNQSRLIELYLPEEEIPIAREKKIVCLKRNCSLEKHCLGVFMEKHEEKCLVCRYCRENNCHFEIQSLCFVPRNCKQLVAHTALHSKSIFVIAASVLITGITEALRFYPTHPKNISLNAVSCFAWKMYASQTFLFSARDLTEAELNSQVINLLFTAKEALKKIGSEVDIVYFFSHLLMHELLAAMWLLSCPEKEFKHELKDHMKSFRKGTFFILYEFMTKICTDPLLSDCWKAAYWKIDTNRIKRCQKYIGHSRSQRKRR